MLTSIGWPCFTVLVFRRGFAILLQPCHEPFLGILVRGRPGLLACIEEGPHHGIVVGVVVGLVTFRVGAEGRGVSIVTHPPKRLAIRVDKTVCVVLPMKE